MTPSLLQSRKEVLDIFKKAYKLPPSGFSYERGIIPLDWPGKDGDSKWEEYFVSIANGTLTVRKNPGLSEEELHSEGNGIKIGDIIKVKVTSKSQIKDGFSWVNVYCDPNKEGGWKSGVKLNEKGWVEGWVAEGKIIEGTTNILGDRRIYKNTDVITDSSTIKEEISGKVDGNGEKIIRNWACLGQGDYPDDVPSDDYFDEKGIKHKRYYVAVGPRILHKDYPDYGECQKDEFNGFSKHIKINLKHKYAGYPRTIYCFVDDIKAHTYNKYDSKALSPYDHSKYDVKIPSTVKNVEFNVENGIIQTGIRYPKASNKSAVWLYTEKQGKYPRLANGSVTNGSVIEFCGHKFKEGENFDFKDFEIVEVIKYKERKTS